MKNQTTDPMNQLIIPTPEEIAREVAKTIAHMGLKSDPEWVDAAQLAERLGTTKQHIERLATYNKIPCRDISIPGSTKRMLRFSVWAVEKWFLEGIK